MICWGGDGRRDHADRVLDAPARDWCIHQQAHEVEGFGLLALFAMEVAGTADGQMGAGWMGHHQIPAISQHLLNRALKVVAWVGLALQQIAAPCVMAKAAEGVTNATAVLAGD